VQKRAPTLTNLFVIVVFVLACFGLLLFLWESFGGPVPLKPKGYRIRADFPNGLQLSEQADVRISGVPVGRIVSLKPSIGETEATMEIEPRYAPIPSDMHAILRQKTLLGETYVQLIPAGSRDPFIPDGGKIPDSQIEPSVTLDQILSTFNPRTRANFRLWQQSWAESFRGRGEDINSFFASLEPFISSTNKLVGLLAAQEGAVTAVIHNTGVVFNALGGRDRQLEGLIVNGQRTFHAAAESSEAFANAFRALPAFESSSETALRELDRFANVSNPYLEQFRASEVQLTPTVQALVPFSSSFQGLLTALAGYTQASKRGLPAFEQVLSLTTPVLRELTPELRNLNPFLQYLGDYEPELQAFFANATAATQATAANENTCGLAPTSLPGCLGGEPGPRQHYLRGMAVVVPETLAVYPRAIGTNRGNPYPHPGIFSSLARGLPVFSSSFCANSAPALNGPPNEYVSETLIQQLRGEPFDVEIKNAFTGKPEIKQFPAGVPTANKPGHANEVPAPACRQQGPFLVNGKTSQFPQVTAEG
jgi:phospholipid/cholesterol/gamma-HCH transport system substrate-binding protein